MVDWDGARALLEETVAGVFDTTELDLIPVTQGVSVNSTRQQDPARPVQRVMGSIHLEPPSDRVSRFPLGDPGAGRTVSYEAVMTARVTDWVWIPKKDDKVIDVAKSEAWQVEARESDGSSRIAFYLSRARHVGG